MTDLFKALVGIEEIMTIQLLALSLFKESMLGPGCCLVDVRGCAVRHTSACRHLAFRNRLPSILDVIHSHKHGVCAHCL